jgi:hypothetical protein
MMVSWLSAALGWDYRERKCVLAHESLGCVPVRVLLVFGGVFLVVGVIWLGQGVGLIGGSFMSGEAIWAAIGGVCIVLGVLLLRTGMRWRHKASLDDD